MYVISFSDGDRPFNGVFLQNLQLGKTCLHLASEGCHDNMVAALLLHGANINATDKVRLRVVINSDILFQWHRNCSYIVQDSNTALHTASKQGSLAVATVLIEGGADVNMLNKVSLNLFKLWRNYY